VTGLAWPDVALIGMGLVFANAAIRKLLIARAKRLQHMSAVNIAGLRDKIRRQSDTLANVCRHADEWRQTRDQLEELTRRYEAGYAALAKRADYARLRLNALDPDEDMMPASSSGTGGLVRHKVSRVPVDLAYVLPLDEGAP